MEQTAEPLAFVSSSFFDLGTEIQNQLEDLMPGIRNLKAQIEVTTLQKDSLESLIAEDIVFRYFPECLIRLKQLYLQLTGLLIELDSLLQQRIRLQDTMIAFLYLILALPDMDVLYFTI
ncbi:hypothetical protein FGO68_gene5265 [Halteria grandinella]|uniref:Uncharacterized protein n=1 Tax=Halteria grandinella TaxID=5974 RepID=A0A8J8NJS0_HALGN|nr:hypothetical protein FGO68_gene5265 [Halteria grandinella]